MGADSVILNQQLAFLRLTYTTGDPLNAVDELVGLTATRPVRQRAAVVLLPGAGCRWRVDVLTCRRAAPISAAVPATS